jgi:hypothetical protein
LGIKGNISAKNSINGSRRIIAALGGDNIHGEGIEKPESLL